MLGRFNCRSCSGGLGRLGAVAKADPAKVAALVAKLKQPLSQTAAQTKLGSLPMPRLGALGISAQGQSAIQMGTAGAKVGATVATAVTSAAGGASAIAAGSTAGSIVPGIGTIVGAAVGVLIAVLFSKGPPRKASAAQKTQCKNDLDAYMGAVARVNGGALGLSYTQLEALSWCLNELYTPHFNTAGGIRDYNVEWLAMKRRAEDIVTAIYTTPIGATITLPAFSINAAGRKSGAAAYSFKNSAFASLNELAERVFIPQQLALCDFSKYGNKTTCQDFATPQWQRFYFDLLASAAQARLPNISEADFVAALQIATASTTPESAAQVVQQAQAAVPSATPKQIPISAQLPVVTSPVVTTAASVPTAAPVTAAPTLPPVTAAIDTNAIVAQLLAQGATPQQAYAGTMQTLQAQGVPITPDLQQQVAADTTTQAGVGAGAPSWLLIGGGLLAVVLATARPRTRKGR